MKKIVSFLLGILLLIGAVGCGQGPDPSEKEKTVTVRLGGLKGPTSMAMVKLLTDNDEGKTANRYAYTLAAVADELTPKFLKGELDAVAIPANLGAVLYQKTGGEVQMLAATMLGGMTIAEKGGRTVQSLADLKGKTVYATGKGSTPEYVLAHLLEQVGLILGQDVAVEWKSEPSETVAAMAAAGQAIALLPQPYVTVASMQIPDFAVSLDLYEEWQTRHADSQVVTAGVMVRKAFAEEHPEAVKALLQDLSASARWVTEHSDQAAESMGKYDIVKAAVAKKALPQCHIVCLAGDEMKKTTLGFFEVLFGADPKSVGEKLPESDFFLHYEK